METFEPEKNPVEVNVPPTDGGVTKSKTSTLTIVGVLLILVSFLLPLILNSLDNNIGISASKWGFLGFIIGALCLLVVLTSTENKSERVVSRVFFTIPFLLLIAVVSFFLIALIANTTSVPESAIGILGILVATIILALIILLFVKIDRTKNLTLKILAWLVGISVYVLIGFFEILLINPPSIFYGTPMYRPKLIK